MTRGQPSILYLNHSTVLGGAERVTLMAMEAARAMGYTPILACPDGGRAADAARDAGFTVIPCDFAWMQHTLRPGAVARYLFGIARQGRRVERLCREHHVCLLHAVSPVAALYAVRAAKRLGLPLILHMHDAQPPKRFRRWAIRYLAKSVSEFVCVSHCVQRTVVSLGIPSARMSVLHNAVSPEFLEPNPAPAAEVTGPGPHIGIFGQLVPWKGQRVFLEAAAVLAQPLPEARFHVIGALAHEDDQPYEDELRQMADRPPLQGRAQLEGYQADVRAWMAAMDVVVHASTELEAFGLVIAEAMALGKAVVATRVGGPSEIVDDGLTGLLVAPGDARALANAITRALSQPEMGIRAAAVIRERFSPHQFVAGLADVYDRWLPRR